MEKATSTGSPVEAAVADAIAGKRVLLAVSGGLDSMVLLHAACRVAAACGADLAAANFDHGTGEFARRSARLVSRRAGKCGVPVHSGRAASAGKRESEWRESRWAFLRSVAADERRVIVTGHNLDDQVETVFMRVLREAGPRGLAGLYADTGVIRPFLDVPRKTLLAYARERRVTYIEDPSNADRTHLRNRVRHDLLPAILRAHPELPSELLEVARESAEWRGKIERVVDALDAEVEPGGSLRVARATLRGYDASSLRILWPALAARARVVMDRRGTHRAAEFTIKGMTGGSIQLSGGVEILMHRDHMLLRRWRHTQGAA